MRILIIEDEVRLASTLKDLMEMNGYTADVCHDGESGLDNALTGIYDVMNPILFPGTCIISLPGVILAGVVIYWMNRKM